MIDLYIIIKSKDNDNDEENNAQNKDNNINKKNTMTSNKTLITDKIVTGEEIKKTYLLHPNYEKTTLFNMQRKHHVY